MSEHRAPGEGRYAHVEREQRWLLEGLPPGVSQPVEIVDRYIEGTRLRLRRVDSEHGSVFKLGQKVRRADRAGAVMMTNIYLDEAELDALVGLPARELRKRRWQLDAVGRRFAVDELHGVLSGLVLAETELGLDDPPIGLPPFAVVEVTHDDRFSGGQLAGISAADAARLVRRRP